MISRMCKESRAKTALRKITCLLLVAVFILSLGGSASMMTYADTPINDYEYANDFVYADEAGFTWFYATEDGTLNFGGLSSDEDAICITTFPIVDSDMWYDNYLDNAYSSVMPLNTIGLRVDYPVIVNSTTLRFTGHFDFPPGELQLSFMGFWTRNHYGGPMREIPGTMIGTLTFTSGNIGGFTPGGRYGVRAVVRVVGSSSNHQSPARWPSTPLPTPTPPPGGGNTPTPPPGGGNTPTPPPGGGTTPTPPPGGGATPTPAPPTPTPQTLSFDPSDRIPWNSTRWRPSGAGDDVRAVVNATQSWSWIQSSGSATWLTVTGSGTPGTPLTFVAQRNDTGQSRDAYVRVTSGTLPPRTFNVTQDSVMATPRGPRVIMCSGRLGYADVQGSSIAASVRGPEVTVPIWDFLPLGNNRFAIRNDSTGQFFTHSSGSLSLAALDNNSNQHWLLVPQPNGSYRIRSLANPALYVNRGLSTLSLATYGANANQQWWIEYIWHKADDRHDQGWVGVWRGDINIRSRPIGPQASTFNFTTEMDTARRAWGDALGITFVTENNVDRANIRAYGGNRREIAEHLGRGSGFVFPELYGTTIPGGRGPTNLGPIQAGGVERTVLELTGVGNSAWIIAVFSDSGRWDVPNSRIINFATMTAIHELGHALGYNGHSPNPSDVMRGHITSHARPNERLRPAEIEHLRQVYRRFRN